MTHYLKDFLMPFSVQYNSEMAKATGMVSRYYFQEHIRAEGSRSMKAIKSAVKQCLIWNTTNPQATC